MRSGVIKLFMYENKLSYIKLADELKVGKPMFSQIAKCELIPDVYFLKTIYNKLKLDPKFILDYV